MTRVAIIGGKLQGLEAAYLGLKAGMETIIVDRKENVPARNLCSYFLCADVLNKEEKLIQELKKADFVLPALENEEALGALAELALEYDLKLAFDFRAYSITSSKLLSDKLIHENAIPAPQYYPDCKSPYIAKPCFGSGSSGVRYIKDALGVELFLQSIPENEEWVVQEFLSGNSYSIEIIGKPGNYRTYEVTGLFMDSQYDCKRVTAPCNISDELKDQFSKIALKLADILQLKGIMDVEVIDDEGTLKVLEIDARIPSQTPTVVYHSSGVNLLEELKDIVCEGSFKKTYNRKSKHVSFEHFLIKDGKIAVLGEHIISEAGPLTLMSDFCGADEVLTDYQPGAKIWRGTFINIADSEQELNEKRENMLKEIKMLQEEELEYLDLSPSDYE